MKQLFLSLVLIFTCSAEAAEIKVLDVAARSSYHVEPQFKVNKELGRAWVQLVWTPLFQAPRDRIKDIVRAKIEGLFFDLNSSTIQLEHEGQNIECAQVISRGRSIFRHDRILSKDCKLEIREVTATLDNGYETIKQKRLHVYLITNEI